jgi:hypothetical protein
MSTTAQSGRQFLLKQRLDEAAHPVPDPGLDRIEPGISGKQVGAVHSRCRAILFHGVVSAGATTPVMAR